MLLQTHFWSNKSASVWQSLLKYALEWGISIGVEEEHSLNCVDVDKNDNKDIWKHGRSRHDTQNYRHLFHFTQV